MSPSRHIGAYSVVGVLMLLAACATPNLPSDDDIVALPDRGDPDDAPASAFDGAPMDSAVPPPTDAGTDAETGAPALRVFVTSTTSKGNLGSFAGADKLCNDLAKAAVLPGVFAAWLSGNATGDPQAITRVTSPGPWKLVSGEVVASSKAQLMSGALAHAIDHDEKGVAVTAQKVWTGTGPNGLYLTNDCDKWTTGGNGRAGLTSGADGTWTSSSVDDCGSLHHVYCFQL